MIFQFDDILIDADVEETSAFYRTAGILTDDCSCENCRNFVSGAELLSRGISDLFLKLGIDILKPAEMAAPASEDNGRSVCYEGWYHICGRMISDTDCWSRDADSGSSFINEKNIYSVTDDFSVGFTNAVSLKEQGFPEPIIQMEVFIHHFPWVLNEPNKL